MAFLVGLAERPLRFSTVAKQDPLSAIDLRSDSGTPIVWMTGAPADAGSILAIYIPDSHPSFRGETTGAIRYLFSFARSTYPRPTYRFSRARARHVAIVHRRVVLDEGLTNAELRADPELSAYAGSWGSIGRSARSALSLPQARAFWRHILAKEPDRESDLRRQLLAPPPHPDDSLYVPDLLKTYAYDAAISCAGEDARYADELYRRLSSRGMRIFYYRAAQARKNLPPPKPERAENSRGGQILREIREVYGSEALLFIPVMSKEYFSSTHASREWVQSMIRGYEFMIPVRLDNEPLPTIIGRLPAYSVGGEAPEFGYDDVVERVSHRLLEFPAQGWETRLRDRSARL